jgi:hypothetical protein
MSTRPAMTDFTSSRLTNFGLIYPQQRLNKPWVDQHIFFHPRRNLNVEDLLFPLALPPG